jgi:uracil-DNA glycosylase family 4
MNGFFKRIAGCQACDLHQCQKPLLDTFWRADVMWVGLSAKKLGDSDHATPLSPETTTGAIIRGVEEQFNGVRFYRTNLVKCPPLDETGKLRYPNEAEMKLCHTNLQLELKAVRPVVVILLGLQVARFFFSTMFTLNPELPKNYRYRTHWEGSTCFVPVHHPSFIAVYRRRHRTSYSNALGRMIRSIVHATTAG